MTLNRYLEFGAVAADLLAQQWIFAKTMPENPHEYTLRKNWPDDSRFIRAVEHIRAYGYKAWFKGRPYIQLDVDDHFYWTMGAPLGSTILINRKRKADPAAYDPIAPVYDSLFTDDASQEENREVMSWLGDVSDLSILDVGCGTGLMLDYLHPHDYTGIDPSRAMLSHLVTRHPDRAADVICTPLASYSGGRFDLVAALFGTASYLSREELERVPTLLEPGGRYLLMFYGPDYLPVTYTRSGVAVPHDNAHAVHVLPGDLDRWHNYSVLRGRA